MAVDTNSEALQNRVALVCVQSLAREARAVLDGLERSNQSVDVDLAAQLIWTRL